MPKLFTWIVPKEYTSTIFVVEEFSGLFAQIIPCNNADNFFTAR